MPVITGVPSDHLVVMDDSTTIAELSQAIEQEVEKCPEAQRLRTHPGVGDLTALAFVLIIGKRSAFSAARGSQLSGAGAAGRLERKRRRWGKSPSRGVRYCVFCWWKRRR